ncbi:uncharacterized protein [Oscarella lobularis]|uniref:uncharacterized protein n=1 Tax=Oscarella lobularis TaxID=121494 RepID=UPI003313A6CA
MAKEEICRILDSSLLHNKFIASRLAKSVDDVVAHIQIDDGFEGRLDGSQFRQFTAQKNAVDRAKSLLTIVHSSQNDETKLRFVYALYAICPSVLDDISTGLEAQVNEIVCQDLAKSGDSLSRCRPLSERLNEALKHVDAKELVLLLVGKTGVGKSTLVNSLFGEKVAEEGCTTERVTTQIKRYTIQEKDMQVTVWDTPGLLDFQLLDSHVPNQQKKRSAAYLTQMRGIGSIDLLLFCVESVNNVASKDDADTVGLITTAFGKKVWDHALVVFTKANLIRDPSSDDDEKHMNITIGSLVKQYDLILRNHGSLTEEQASKVPFVPVGSNRDKVLADGRPWKPELWVTAAEATRQGRGKIVLIAINAGRLKAGSVLESSDTNDDNIQLDQEQIRRIAEEIRNVRLTSSLWISLMGLLTGWWNTRHTTLLSIAAKYLPSAIAGATFGVGFVCSRSPKFQLAGALVASASLILANRIATNSRRQPAVSKAISNASALLVIQCLAGKQESCALFVAETVLHLKDDSVRGPFTPEQTTALARRLDDSSAPVVREIASSIGGPANAASRSIDIIFLLQVANIHASSSVAVSNIATGLLGYCMHSCLLHYAKPLLRPL